MAKIEYLDPEIANEGERADAAFVAPKRVHVWDYAQLKEHEHYGKYFVQKPFRAFPAWIYNHKTGETKIVGDAKAAAQYGVSYNTTARFHHYECVGDWMDEPPKNAKADVTSTGKSLVSASASQAANTTADTMAQILKKLIADKASPELSEAISADKEYQEYLAFKRAQSKKVAQVEPVTLEAKTWVPPVDEKALLIEAAESRNIKVDKRWSIDRIKSELDKAA